jgi:5-hydroxyisourate hydrolase-like protein (transthyretin family)
LPKPVPGSNALQPAACAQALKVGVRLCVSLMIVLAGSLASRAAHADQEACISNHEEAQLMRLRGRYTAARESLLRCTQMQCPALIAKDCIALLGEVDASLPSVVFAVSDAAGADLVDVRVSANGRVLAPRLEGRAITLDPGVYTLRFEAAGYATAQQVVTVLEGQKQRLIRVQLAPAEEGAALTSETASTPTRAQRAARHQSRQAIVSYALGGSALAVLGAGVALGVVGKRKYDDCKRTEACTEDEISKGKALYTTADIAFGVSAGLAIAATWLYFDARSKSKRERPTALDKVSANVHAHGASLAWRSSF